MCLRGLIVSLIYFLGSEVLRKLHQDFLNCIQKGDIDMLSYGETEPSRIVRDTLVVPRESAGISFYCFRSQSKKGHLRRVSSTFCFSYAKAH